MDKTPKMPRKSLSLRRRLSSRYSGSDSPQHCPNLANAVDTVASPKSPSVITISGDSDNEYSPSPSPFDCSFSPGSLQSQTMVSQSPEVSWAWTERNATDHGHIEKKQAVKSSSNPTSKDNIFMPNPRTSREIISRRRMTYDKRKEEHRKAAELKIRRAEKTKLNVALKKLTAQLDAKSKEENVRGSPRTNGNKDVFDSAISSAFGSSSSSSLPSSTAKTKQTISTVSTSNCLSKKPADQTTKTSVTAAQSAGIQSSFTNSSGYESNNNIDSIIELLNDDDGSEFLLIEATQQIESKIIGIKEKPQGKASKTTDFICNTKSTPPPPPANKKARSSMHKLLNDSQDEYFSSFNDADLLATQSTNKSRTSLQRYKSLPVPDTKTVTKTLNTAESSVPTVNYKRFPSSGALSTQSSKFHNRFIPSKTTTTLKK